MAIILDQYNEATKTEIALGTSNEDNFEAGEFIKLLARVYTVCNITNNGDEDILFGSCVTKIDEHDFWPMLSVKELLAVLNLRCNTSDV